MKKPGCKKQKLFFEQEIERVLAAFKMVRSYPPWSTEKQIEAMLAAGDWEDAEKAIRQELAAYDEADLISESAVALWRSRRDQALGILNGGAA